MFCVGWYCRGTWRGFLSFVLLAWDGFLFLSVWYAGDSMSSGGILASGVIRRLVDRHHGSRLNSSVMFQNQIQFLLPNENNANHQCSALDE